MFMPRDLESLIDIERAAQGIDGGHLRFCWD